MSASEISIHLPSSAGVTWTVAILRYSGARNRILRASKYLLSSSAVGCGMSPACAGPSITYSMLRCDFEIG